MSTQKQIQIGWAVRVLGGTLMFFDLDKQLEASSYCEDGASPVAVWADAKELGKHDAEQDES